MRQLLTLVLFSATLLSAQTSKEAALGNLVMQELGRRWKIVDTPEYVAGIVQKLPVTAQRPITLKVVESDQAIANNLPGGVVYVTTAVLKAAEPSELAGILAHEFAHVFAHHGTVGTSDPGIPIVFMGGWTGICTRMAEPGSVVMPKSYEPKVASNEAEADSIATEYLRKAGYDIADLASVFSRVQSLSNKALVPARKTPTLIR